MLDWGLVEESCWLSLGDLFRDIGGCVVIWLMGFGVDGDDGGINL
jgi:hypothetical protein